MTANDLYVRMMREHPIQREWMPKDGDRVCFKQTKYVSFVYSSAMEHVHGASRSEDDYKEDCFYLPTQEQWQEKYDKSFDRWVFPNDLTAPTIKHIDGLPLNDFWTILWCLFVSNEVYGIVWDWEKNVWRKA